MIIVMTSSDKAPSAYEVMILAGLVILLGSNVEAFGALRDLAQRVVQSLARILQKLLFVMMISHPRGGVCVCSSRRGRYGVEMSAVSDAHLTLPEDALSDGPLADHAHSAVGPALLRADYRVVFARAPHGLRSVLAALSRRLESSR